MRLLLTLALLASACATIWAFLAVSVHPDPSLWPAATWLLALLAALGGTALLYALCGIGRADAFEGLDDDRR